MSDALDYFKRSIQALAQPGHIQLSLFPDGVAKGDELMIDFEESLRQARPHLEKMATPPQLQAIQELDDYSQSIGGMQNEELWSDESTLISDHRWQKVRDLAKEVLPAFGWENASEGVKSAVDV